MIKQKRAALYVRVSTAEQSTKAQEAELRAYAERRGWCVKKVYADVVSGTTDSRSALNELMQDCQRGAVDLVAVWKFDRFGRSLRHLVNSLDEFKRLKIDFVSATEGIDTTSGPTGELIFQIFGAIAQWEREAIVSRVKCGLAEAKRTGKILGRPAKKKLSIAEMRRIRSDRSRGATLRELATRFGASVWSVHQTCK